MTKVHLTKFGMDQLIKMGMEDGIIDYVQGQHVVTPFGEVELKALSAVAFPNEDVDTLDPIEKRALLMTLKYVDPEGRKMKDDGQSSSIRN